MGNLTNFDYYIKEIEAQLNLVNTLKRKKVQDYIIATHEQDLIWLREIIKDYPKEWEEYNKPHNPKDINKDFTQAE